jgi:protein TonB
VFSVSSWAQTETVDISDTLSENVFELFQIEQVPVFPGGTNALNLWLNQNISYPRFARENNVEGKVYVSFVIEKDGSVSNVVALRKLGAGCTEEAIRIVKIMPPWIPGKYHGQIVRVKYVMPVEFKLPTMNEVKNGG